MTTITHPAETVSTYAIPGIRARKHSKESIAAAISEILHIPVDLMKVKTRKFEIMRARQICAYFMRDNGYTYDEIGLFFLKDHATMIHSVRIIESEIQYDRGLRELVAGLKNGILHKGTFNKQW